jgi:hypothetical protein
MGNAVAIPGGDLAALMGGLKTNAKVAPEGGGKGYLKYAKGEWSFGKENVDVMGERIVVNPMEWRAGFVCWTNYSKEQMAELKKKKLPAKNKLLDEVLQRSIEGPVDEGDLPSFPDEPTAEWRPVQQIEGRFLDGDREEFKYNTSSYGGRKALGEVNDAILSRLTRGETVYLFPVLELGTDSYDHESYGTTHTPVLTIVGWADTEGNMEGEETPAVEPPAATEEEFSEDPSALGGDEPEQEEEPAPPTRVRRARR